jgi:predicted ArsR family transcriptional regulator
METERIALNQRERDRLRVLHQVQQKQITQIAAAARLKVSDRQVRRMLLRIRERGDAALVPGLRGRPSNRGLAARLELNILRRVRQRYADFGPHPGRRARPEPSFLHLGRVARKRKTREAVLRG